MFLREKIIAFRHSGFELKPRAVYGIRKSKPETPMIVCPSILSIDVYRTPQTSQMRIPSPWICANLSGLVSLESYLPDGSLEGTYSNSADGPFLHFAMQGGRQKFSYRAGREDWVLFFAPDMFSFDAASGRILLHTETGPRELQAFQPLSPDEAAHSRAVFAEIRRAWRSGAPADRDAAELLAGSLLARFLSGRVREEPPGKDPAERFRSLLDNESLRGESIETLSRRCGYSRDRMRALFTEKFGIAPRDYRARKRLDFLLHEVLHSGLPLKEIAGRAGLRHVQHLYAIFQQNGLETPKLLSRRYHDSAPDSAEAQTRPAGEKTPGQPGR